MIVEAILAVIKFIILGVISILPSFPKVDISYLDGVFQVLSMTDLIVNVKVLAVCLGILFTFMNIELIWGLIMWVVRKLPFVN